MRNYKLSSIYLVLNGGHMHTLFSDFYCHAIMMHIHNYFYLYVHHYSNNTYQKSVAVVSYATYRGIFMLSLFRARYITSVTSRIERLAEKRNFTTDGAALSKGDAPLTHMTGWLRTWSGTHSNHRP